MKNLLLCMEQEGLTLNTLNGDYIEDVEVLDHEEFIDMVERLEKKHNAKIEY